MEVKIIEGCIGCELCTSICPNVFRMTNEGFAEVFAKPGTEDEDGVKEAAESCPVNVISVSDN